MEKDPYKNTLMLKIDKLSETKKMFSILFMQRQKIQ